MTERTLGEQGRNKGGSKQGNKNGAKGPRGGRKDKTTEPLPQPQPEALAGLPKRRRHEKTPGSGSDFQKGQNSHTGTVFQRGRDQIPRGNGNLMLRIIYNDKRQRFYDQICALTV